jgi:putative ABC transport system substrate-binding protein
VLIQDHPLLTQNRKVLADLAIRHRLASAGYSEFSEAGGMIGYGANFVQLYRRAAYFVDRIFKGTKPADIPMEQPTKFELVVNLKTAKALGIKIPQSVLARADNALQ